MTRLDDELAAGYVLAFEDRFDGHDLDRSRWLPWYLPQWSSRAASAARYRLTDDGLELRIDPEQPPWCPELDGQTRVSSIQTGVFAGPVGSSVGQHRFQPDAVVREEQDAAPLCTPRYGAFALRARAELDASSMAALWMIGYEDRPERSAEICIAEIFGRNVEADGAAIGMGVHPFGDPSIADDFAEVRLPIDVGELHDYAATWRPGRVSFFVDGEHVRTAPQSPDYPMQFMLGVYRFGDPSQAMPIPRFVVRSVAVYEPPSD